MAKIGIPKRRDHKYAYLKHQQMLIQKNYKFLTCSVRFNVLRCTGIISSPDFANTYKVLIEYVLGKEPKTTILHPKVEPSKHIHMYGDHSLCLSYPPDIKWSEKSCVASLSIPWLAEWIVYYELYLVNGSVWEGAQSPAHLTEATKNINQDLD